MKKALRIAFMLCAVAVLALSFAGCASAEEKAVVGKYNLSKVTGLTGVTASTYDYSYIELKANKTYHIENKVNGITTQQDGKWSLKGETITFKITSLATSQTEEHTLADGVLKMSGSTVVSGTTYTFSMEFTKAE